MTSRFRLSLAHATLLETSPPDLVRIAAATGYEFVGLRLIPMGRLAEPRHALAEHPEYLRETKRTMADTGVRCLDVEVAQIKEGTDPRSYLPALEAVAELGGRFVLTNVYTPDRQFAEDGVAALCDLVEPLGLTIALEFVSFSNVATVEQAVEIVRNCLRENAAILVDALHFHSAGERADHLSRIPAHLIHYVHLCDGPREVPASADGRRRIAREGRLLPGEGGIDVAGLVRHLPAGIVYAVEAPNPARSAELGAEAYARLAFEMTSGCLESARAPNAT
jgi:sugar phosphate isomerase/epimerase